MEPYLEPILRGLSPGTAVQNTVPLCMTKKLIVHKCLKI